jgi:ADP-heptose:LPS heptosyltransferase
MRTLRTEKEARFLLAGGPAEADLTERLAEAVAPYALNTVGKISYQGTTVLMRRCDMVLTSDTAALHLAWAAGAAGVALFRKENLGRYRPATEKIICLAGEDTGEEVSLEISVDEVTRACLECLDRQELAG